MDKHTDATTGFLDYLNAQPKPLAQKPVDRAAAEEIQQAKAAEQRKKDTTVWDGIGAVQVKGGIGFIDRLVQSMDYSPTPGYVLPEDSRKRWESLGIRPEQWELFGRAVSDDHLHYLEGLAIQNQMADEDLSQFGMVGNMALSLTDPVATGIDLLSGGLGYSAKVGRLANLARSGAQGAAVTGLMDTAQSVYNPEMTVKQTLVDSAMSFAMAGALGARKGLPQDDVSRIRETAGVDDPNKENMGAAKVSGIPDDPTPGVMPLRAEDQTSRAFADRAIENADIKPAFSPVRADLAAVGGNAKSPEMREATRLYHRDGVGYTDRDVQVQESAPEFAKRHLQTLDTELRAGIGAVWSRAKEDNHWGFLEAQDRYHDFQEEVGRAVRGDTDVSPHAKEAADVARKVLQKTLKLGNESGLDIADAGPNYLPRYFSERGFRTLFSDYGLDEDEVTQNLLVPAMRKAWDMGDPEDAAKHADIEQNALGTSSQATRARERAEDSLKETNDRRQALKDAEEALAERRAEGATTPAAERRIRAAERRVADADRKLQRSIERHEKAKAKLKDRLESDAEAKSARKSADEQASNRTAYLEELLPVVAKAWLKRAQANFEKNSMDLLLRPLDSSNIEELRSMLTEAGVSAERSAKLLSALENKVEEGGKAARARHRIDIDENFSTTFNRKGGDKVVVKVSDLLDNNIDSVMTRYLREMTGWSALSSKAGVKNRSELEKFHSSILDAERRAGGSVDKQKRLLEIGEAATFGRSTEQNPSSAYSKWGRFLRNWNVGRLMNQVGFVQWAELGPTLAYSGVKGLLMSAPEAQGFLRRGADGLLTTKEARVVEQLFGAPGTEPLRNPAFLRLDDADGLMSRAIFSDSDSPKLRKLGENVENLQSIANHATSWLSGMAPINIMLQRFAARGFLIRMMDLAKKANPGAADIARLRNWGLSEADQAKVFAVLRKAKNIEDIDPDALDFKTREAMSSFLFRASRKIVLEGDTGDSVLMMHNTTGRLFLQFRSFMFYSYTNHFLNSLRHLDDWRTYAMMILSTASAGMGWAARAYLNTIGDPEQREKVLTFDNFAKNAVAQSSWSNFVPTVTDSVFKDAMGITPENAEERLGFNPLFTDNRSTGLQNGIMGVPALDLSAKLYGSTRMLGSMMWEDEHVTKKQVQDFAKIFWLQNMTGVRNIVNEVADQFPDRKDGTDK